MDSTRLPIRVLLIEDLLAVRRGMRQLLEKHGYVVHELSSGVGAEAAVRQFDIDVVVTDLAMPDRQGVDTIRGIRHEFPELPVIVVTATPFASLAQNLGAYRCFSKPVLFADLSAAIEELYQSWRTREGSSTRRGQGSA